MQKRGQSTLIVSVAIIIILILAIFSYYSSTLTKSKSIKDSLTIPQSVESLKSTIQECLKDSLAYSTYLVASHGGSLDVKNSMQVPELGRIQVGYNKASNSVNLPSQSLIASEISNSIASEVEECSNIKENFPGLISEFNLPEASVIIENNKIKASLQYPIIVKKGSTEAKVMDVFESDLNVNLPLILKTANDLLDTIKNDPDYLDLYFIQNAPVSITFLPLENEQAVFILTDEDSLIKDIPLSLVFGTAYK